jgi:hypothetical protein
MKMMKVICSERRILRQGKTQYSWRLPIFDTIQWDDGETTAVVQTSIPSFCLLYQRELLGSVTSGSSGSSGSGGVFGEWDKKFYNSLGEEGRMYQGVPFEKTHAKRMLRGKWFDDDIINGYLVLCGFFRKDIKFLSTHWFTLLHNSSDNDILKKAITWVSSLFPP